MVAESFDVAGVIQFLCQFLARREAAVEIEQLHQIDDRLSPIELLFVLAGELGENGFDIDLRLRRAWCSRGFGAARARGCRTRRRAARAEGAGPEVVLPAERGESRLLRRLRFGVTKDRRHDVSEDAHGWLLLSWSNYDAPHTRCRSALQKVCSSNQMLSIRQWLSDCTATHQSCCVRNVSQLATSPDFKPVMNQRVRCAEVPCVKASGTT